MYSMEGLTAFEAIGVWSVIAIALLGLIYALVLRRQILKEDMGTAKMQEVWGSIRQGAETYLTRQLRSILPMIAILTVALFLSVYIVPPTPEALQRFQGMSQSSVRLIVGLGRGIGFIMGAGFSLAVGQIGMRMAVNANVRVASASRTSFGDALRIAYRAGTITGMMTNAFGLFGGTLLFIYFGIAAPDALLGFGFGGTLLALFMRVGGGIYTKAADVGADLVGKVEAGIPEDDPRNPAVIADLVGDNVGDCAGMAADIFESYEVTIVASLILALALWHLTGKLEWIIFPLLARGIGVFASIFGTYSVRSGAKKSSNAMQAIFGGFMISAVISVVLFGLAAFFYLGSNIPGGWWRPFAATTVGILLALAIDRLTDYFTGTNHPPVKEIKRSTDTGPATMILSGIAVGYESSVWSVIVIAITIVASILIFGTIPGVDTAQQVTFILYGVSLTGIGMLALTGNVVAMDSYGPIADNAAGIGEMAWAGQHDDETQRRSADHGRSGRRGEHHQGHHQRRGHRIGGHRRRGPIRFFPGGRQPGASRIGYRTGPADPKHRDPRRSASGLRRSVDRCRPPLAVLVVRHQRRQPGRHPGGRRGPTPIQTGRTRRQGQAGLPSGGGHLHHGGAEGTGLPGPARCAHADRGRPGPAD